MNRKVFSLCSLFIIGSIFFMPSYVNAKEECYYENNNNICMTETEYNNLLNMGFEEFEIQNMQLNEFNNNKDLIGEVVASATNYIRDTYYYKNGTVTHISELVSEEEYNNYNPNNLMQGNLNGDGLLSYDGYVETTMKKMRTKIVSSGSRYRYKNNLDWKSNPSTRSYDIIGIGLENTKVYPYGNQTFQQTYCTTAANCTSNNSATIGTMETGVAAVFQLPSGSYYSMSSSLYYDVEKKYSGTITSLYAYGDYAHATSTISQSAATGGYVINSGGIHLSSTISSYYDSMNTAVANWAGTW